MKKVVTGWVRSGKAGVLGKPKVDAVDFNGKGCDKATEALRNALGTEHELTNKPEREAEDFEVEGEGETELE